MYPEVCISQTWSHIIRFFAMHSTISRAQENGFQSWWFHVVRMGKGFQWIINDYGK